MRQRREDARGVAVAAACIRLLVIICVQSKLRAYKAKIMAIKIDSIFIVARARKVGIIKY